jgi:uncharacterized protein (TIRG00374 family)
MKTGFFRRRGVAMAAAVAAGALVGAAAAIVQAVVLGVSLGFAGSRFRIDQAREGTSWTGLGWVVVVLVVAIVAAGIAMRVPKIRRKVVAAVREAFRSLRSVLRNPRKLAQIFLGNLGSQLLYALTLGASLAAFGGSAPLAVLVIVNTATSLIAGVAPTPGGLGVAEATMVAALTAAGVPAGIAVPAVLTHRLVTSWFMPVPGWFVFRHLSRRGEL